MSHKLFSTTFHLDVSLPDTGALPRLLRILLPTPGNVIFTLAMIALLVAAQSAGTLPLGRPQAAPAAASTGTIAYQGRLADANGNPLTGTYNMIFRLYAVPTGGTPLWEEQWTGSNGVRVSDGLFNVMLGSLHAIDQSVIAGHDQLWLGITVDTDDERQPRVQLGSVPFAVQALNVTDETLIRTFAAANARVQYGTVVFISDACDAITVTFPQPFTEMPIVLITQREASAGYGNYVVFQVTPTGFKVHKNGAPDCTTDGWVNWIAIGR
jgi:hypothetical protein